MDWIISLFSQAKFGPGFFQVKRKFDKKNILIKNLIKRKENKV
jgi:hypothetical protein